MSSFETRYGVCAFMDARWLEDFLTVAETGNFTRAAQLRNVSQAAFSRRIKTLESWLRTQLIDRTTTPIRLTRDGQRFRERAVEIMRQINEARLSIGETGTVRRKPVRAALVYSLASGALPQWWNDWAAEAGDDVLYSVISGNASDCLAALMTGNADLVVCHQPDTPGMCPPAELYEQLVIGQDILAPYAAPALAGPGLFSGQRGEPAPLLMYARPSSFARAVETIIANAPHRMPGRVVFKAETSAVLRAMAVAGHGVAWLPECVAREAPPGALRRLDAGEWSARLDIVAYRDRQARIPLLDRLWSQSRSGRENRAPAMAVAGSRAF
ncbi:LysR family transcriptional regulator [Caulobacter sp.]|nr:LysR family transcriptional regulator [Caulobacter sp.]MBQ1563218.1 LysR family transcriptional regulator [Caulobacter sp.]